MEKKSIKVADFVEQYNNLKSDELKNKLISPLIYREYVPVLEKKLFLQKMFDKSIVGEAGNQYVDMFVNKINATISILQMYTNLTFVKDDESETNIFDDYDMLVESGLINIIFGLIPESELKAVLTINDQIMETFYNEYYSPRAYISSMVDRFGTIAGEFMGSSTEALLEILKDENKMNSIIGKIPKIDNVIELVDRVVKKEK